MRRPAQKTTWPAHVNLFAYRLFCLSTHSFHFNCVNIFFNCIFTQIRCLSVSLPSYTFRIPPRPNILIAFHIWFVLETNLLLSKNLRSTGSIRGVILYTEVLFFVVEHIHLFNVRKVPKTSYQYFGLSVMHAKVYLSWMANWTLQLLIILM